jgi:hypothetical protein
MKTDMLALCEEQMDELLAQDEMDYLNERSIDEQLILMEKGMELRLKLNPEGQQLVTALAAYALVTHRLKRQHPEDAATEGTVAV